MTTIRNLIATFAVLVALNPIAEKLLKDGKNADGKSKPETIRVEDKPEKDEKAPPCTGGGGHAG